MRCCYGKEKDRYYSYERFSQEIDAILQYLISHQIALEVNTAGLRMLGFTNPHPDVIRRYREMGGELITVGSDGHVPEYLAMDLTDFRNYCLTVDSILIQCSERENRNSEKFW